MRLRSALTMVRAQRSGSGPDTQTAMRLVKALAAMAALHSVMFYLWSRLPVGVSMASHKARLLRAVVVLTGLLTLLGDVGDANAATMITTPETHDFTVSPKSPNLSQASTSVSFHTFNQALGTLTGVGYSINSSFVSDSPLNYTASISTFGNELISPSSSGPNFSVAFNDDANASLYIGNGITTFDVVFQLIDNSLDGVVIWSGAGDTLPGLMLAYDYTPFVTIPPPVTTPIPTALPLFASGAGLLGFLGRRRKRKLIAA